MFLNPGWRKAARGVCWPGVSAIVGGFLVNLTVGSLYSFGNVMPYMASYMR